jgi:hypothetical protein
VVERNQKEQMKSDTERTGTPAVAVKRIVRRMAGCAFVASPFILLAVQTWKEGGAWETFVVFGLTGAVMLCVGIGVWLLIPDE